MFFVIGKSLGRRTLWLEHPDFRELPGSQLACNPVNSVISRRFFALSAQQLGLFSINKVNEFSSHKL